MSISLTLRGYDLSDDGPTRSFNEDATLVREDLGLFALADGAGGKGRGDLASALALRTIENYIGATVRRTHERPDYDRLGTAEQAKRLSVALHQANRNLREALQRTPEKESLATTIVATLLAPRTGELHIAHVGDSRCYRMRHGRLELLTEDHSVALDLLARRPDVPDEVLEKLPRNSVVHALGMAEELRVSLRTVLVAPGDRFLLCSDGLSSWVPFDKIWRLLKEPDPCSVVASELLGHALSLGSEDNISVIVIDCEEFSVTEELPTRPYNENPDGPASIRLATVAREEPEDDDAPVPSSRLQLGPEILSDELLEMMDAWSEDEGPTIPLEENSGVEVTAEFLAEPAVERDRHHDALEETWPEEAIPPSFEVGDDDLEVDDVATEPNEPKR